MARIFLATFLLCLPLAGCLAGAPASTPFAWANLAADPRPVAPSDCSDLREGLNQRALREAYAGLQASVDGRPMLFAGPDFVRAGVQVDAVAMDASDGAFGGASAPRAQATTTNNQEGDADEGDLLKTDGEWTYVLTRSGTLHVLAHDGLGTVREVHRMAFPASWQRGQLLLEPRGPGPSDDRLVVVLPRAEPGPASTNPLTQAMQQRATDLVRIAVFDLGDRTDPTLVSDAYVEGQVAGVRLVDGVAHVVVQWHPDSLGLATHVTFSDGERRLQRMLGHSASPARLQRAAEALHAENQQRIDDVPLRQHLPLVLHGAGEPASPLPLGDRECRAVLANAGPTGRAVTTILSVDVAGDLAMATQQVLGATATVYASGHALVLAAPSVDAWWAEQAASVAETTDVHWFDLDGLEVVHRASGRVPGSVLDSFGLDVHGDQLRVVSTLNTWRWRSLGDLATVVTAFQPVAGLLVPTGAIPAIAPGERLWSVRFTEDRAYLVTFRNTDPLWVVDVSTPLPRILGELQIPGVSTYLHPVDDTTVLALGYGPAGDDGLGIDRSSVQVSIFDVSDPRHPRRAAVLDLATGGSSTAIDEHKAFTYWPALGRLAIPVRHHVEGEAQATLQLVAVDVRKQTLAAQGEVRQAQLPGWTPDIERSFFLGYPEFGVASLYAVSEAGVTAHDVATLQDQQAVAFAPATPT